MVKKLGKGKQHTQGPKCMFISKSTPCIVAILTLVLIFLNYLPQC